MDRSNMYRREGGISVSKVGEDIEGVFVKDGRRTRILVPFGVLLEIPGVPVVADLRDDRRLRDGHGETGREKKNAG